MLSMLFMEKEGSMMTEALMRHGRWRVWTRPVTREFVNY